MEIKSKNTIRFPKYNQKIQHKRPGKVKRISGDGITPVALEFIDSDSTLFSAGDFIHPGQFIAEKYFGRKMSAPTGSGSAFSVTITDGNSWDSFPTEFIEFHTSTPGKIKRISANGAIPIILEYDENVNLNEIKSGNYIYYSPSTATIDNLIPRKIISVNETLKQILIGDFLVTDPSTKLIDFDSFPITFTDEYKWEDRVNIIQHKKSGSGDSDEYTVFYEIHGARTENILLFINWDFPNSTNIIIKPEFFGYFYKDKVALWYSKDDVINTSDNHYFSDSIETIAGNISDFDPRSLTITGKYSIPIPLNIPASVRFVKFLITTSKEETTGELWIDIDENSIGKRA